MPSNALITGITGQDGSYLAELLKEKGYNVFGTERRKALEDQSVKRQNSATIIPCDITNYASVVQAVIQSQPNEIYHLAAQSDVGHSFKDPFQTMDTNVMGTLNVLEAARIVCPKARIYFAGSSEMFGKVTESPQNENTRFNPRSPYGVSKVAGFQLCKNYREAYEMFISCGILFNHESPRRGKEFVTRKITSQLREIVEGKRDKIYLGNLEAKRDWGYAPDYVEGMWRMLQQEKPDDYVLATNETHSIREFIDEAFGVVGIIPKHHIEVDPKFFRPTDIMLLRGDYSKAKEKLGWEPTMKFQGLVRKMIHEERRNAE